MHMAAIGTSRHSLRCDDLSAFGAKRTFVRYLSARIDEYARQPAPSLLFRGAKSIFGERL
jgi:hypothetical protein